MLITTANLRGRACPLIMAYASLGSQTLIQRKENPFEQIFLRGTLQECITE